MDADELVVLWNFIFKPVMVGVVRIVGENLLEEVLAFVVSQANPFCSSDVPTTFMLAHVVSGRNLGNLSLLINLNCASDIFWTFFSTQNWTRHPIRKVETNSSQVVTPMRFGPGDRFQLNWHANWPTFQVSSFWPLHVDWIILLTVYGQFNELCWIREVV